LLLCHFVVFVVVVADVCAFVAIDVVVIYVDVFMIGFAAVAISIAPCFDAFYAIWCCFFSIGCFLLCFTICCRFVCARLIQMSGFADVNFPTLMKMMHVDIVPVLKI
jgi:hypothetical protein